MLLEKLHACSYRFVCLARYIQRTLDSTICVNGYYKCFIINTNGHCIYFPLMDKHFFFLWIKREQKATAAAANLIYLDSRICRLCKWPAPGLLCASIHYHHKALDVSPLCLFCAKHRAGGRTRLSITGSVTRAAWEMAKQRGMSALN